jgi:tetratricopeptide (TPR) repeat protein
MTIYSDACRLLQHQKKEEALEAFKIMVETYQESAYAYDGLADAYEAVGNKKEAIRNSEICLQKLEVSTGLDPGFREKVRSSAIARINRLKS